MMTGSAPQLRLWVGRALGKGVLADGEMSHLEPLKGSTVLDPETVSYESSTVPTYRS